MKHRKNLICILLCMCIFAGIFSACAEEKQPEVPVTDGYAQLPTVMSENQSALELLEHTDTALGTIEEPDIQAYTRALTTAMVSYDLQHASTTKWNCQMKNIRAAKTSNADFTQVQANCLSDIWTTSPYTAPLVGEITMFFQVASENATYDQAMWLDTVAALETILSTYDKGHMFLQLIVDNTTGSLKTAAQDLLKSVDTAVKLILKEFHADGVYPEHFFATQFLEVFQNDGAYVSGSSFKIMVDTALEVTAETKPTAATVMNTEGDAWKVAYLNTLLERELSFPYGSFALIYIDNDQIPELYHRVTEDYSTLFSSTGRVVSTLDLETLSYSEKRYYFIDSGGRQDNYYFYVYGLEDGVFARKHTGEYGYIHEDLPENWMEDPLFEREYQYYWDGQKVSEAEFRDLQISISVWEQAVPCEPTLHYTEIIKEIILY